MPISQEDYERISNLLLQGKSLTSICGENNALRCAYQRACKKIEKKKVIKEALAASVESPKILDARLTASEVDEMVDKTSRNLAKMFFETGDLQAARILVDLLKKLSPRLQEQNVKQFTPADYAEAIKGLGDDKIITYEEKKEKENAGL